MTDNEIYLYELKNMAEQVGEKAKLFTNEAIKTFVLNCLKRKEVGVQPEVIASEQQSDLANGMVVEKIK